MEAATWGVVIATFVACFVEMVEAATIVMAMGFTRGWRSAIAGMLAALVALAIFTVIAGYALSTWLPESSLQLVIGTLLLIFGLQWLRKAVLRSSGRKSMHDEDEIYREEVEAAQAAERPDSGLDMFSFVISFKGVFLEGVEVVFIVITFGTSANSVRTAAAGAVAAAIAVLVIAVLVRRPLSMIPENTLKYGVGLLLTTFGTFWVVEGMGALRAGRESIEWPGGDVALLGVLLTWFIVSRIMVSMLRVPGGAARQIEEVAR